MASPAATPTDPLNAVRVQAPGRLHLGFLDPSGSLGRRFGSLGLVIGGLHTTVVLRHAEAPANGNRVHADPADAGGETDRARAHLTALQRATGRDAPLDLQLVSLLPAHAGFGSGTQLALAIGRAFARLHGLPLSTTDLARLLGRGLRSGVGIAGFDRGGLLLDGGPGPATPDGAPADPAPLLARFELPAAWRVLLVLEPGRRGLSGADEKVALAELPPFAEAQAAAVCHQVLMRVLPGAASGDFALFAHGVTRMQQLVGSHFAPAQAGSLYASPAVARVCEWLGAQGPAGIGQSSWGPTGFAIVDSADRAQQLLTAAQHAGVVDPRLALRTVAPRALGAVVDVPGDGARPSAPVAPVHLKAATDRPC